MFLICTLHQRDKRPEEEIERERKRKGKRKKGFRSGVPVACVRAVGLLEVIRLHRFHVHLCFFPLSSTGAGADASAVASSGFRNHLSLFPFTAHILSPLLLCFIMCFNAYLRFSLNFVVVLAVRPRR